MNKYEQVEEMVKSRLQVIDNNIVLDGEIIGGHEKERGQQALVNHVAYEAATDVADDGMSIDESIARHIEIAKTNVSYRELFGWVNLEPRPFMGY